MRFYDGDRLDSTNRVSDSYLYINSCGIQGPYGYEYNAQRLKGRVDYHLFYVLEGTTYAEYKGQSYQVRPGGFVLYLPGQSQSYRDDPHTRRAWVHFSGTAVMEILDEIGITGGVYPAVGDSLQDAFLRLVAQHNAAAPLSEAKSVLLGILYRLGRDLAAPVQQSSRMDDCAAYIVAHYAAELAVSDLAARCHLSQSRFMYLFKQRFGVAPKEYQKTVRMEHARHLLVSTDLTVSEVGGMVGYHDPLYFSRLFRQTVGLSPRNFQKNPRFPLDKTR